MLLAVFIFLLCALSAFSHPGGVDLQGGHYNRSNGRYHFHQNHTSPPPFIPSSQTLGKTSVSEDEKSRRISNYFRLANEHVGALECRQRMHPREVSLAKKALVLARDEYRCVICGSRVKIEVDHRRALMNGGDNSVGNLATLCDDCHTAKTRMDNSLRRKREKLCGT